MSPTLATTTHWQADFTPSADFTHAFNTLEHSRKNVLLTGKAGSGKSTFLDYFKKNTKKKVVVLAPTGVAALNVGGQTVHSFFGFKPTFLDPTKKHTPRHKAIIRALDVLVIDEISMVRADVFDALASILKQFGPKPTQPFGGVQLCLIGDLFQLPPIVSRHDADFFPHFYQGAFFFNAKAYQDSLFEKIDFETVYRQQDGTFLHILNAIRAGQAGRAEIEALNKRTISGMASTGQDNILTLTTRAIQADDINRRQLMALHGEQRVYSGKAKGVFASDGATLPAPQELALKVGAQVMFTKNDAASRRWVNGSLGIVKTLHPDYVAVEVLEGGRPQTYHVEAEKWQTVKYVLEGGQLATEETGSFTQVPLILAWAITIHKSQGKTLEKVVIDLGAGAFAAGQLYVALSRCKILEGITLTKPVQLRDMSVDRSVISFMTEGRPALAAANPAANTPALGLW